MRYTAPAAKILTVVHVVDEFTAPDRRFHTDRWTGKTTEKPDSHTGATVCGLTMLSLEVWIDVDPDVAPPCWSCTHPGDTDAHEQMTLG